MEGDLLRADENAAYVEDENMISHMYSVAGMDCGHCAAKLQKAVLKLDGVKEAAVNFATGKMQLRCDPARVTTENVLAVIRGCGYQGRFGDVKVGAPAAKRHWYREPKTMATFFAALFWAAGMALELTGGPANLCFALAMASGGFFVAKSGLYALRRFQLDTNFLLTVAAIGAVVLGEWSEGATVVFLFAVGNALQAYTIEKTRRSVESLMELAPQQAIVRRADGEVLLPVEEIAVDDVMVVKPGMRIAMDGIVVEGTSDVDQASITGESLPVTKQGGDEVFAGTANGAGAMLVRVTKRAGDSALSRIMRLVEEAEAKKAPLEQQVDRFAKYYTPAILVGAALLAVVPPTLFGASWSEWIYKALVLLVISCPCALVISTPVSVVAAIGRASRMGVLVKGGEYLEQLGSVRAVAFDKTGTLTYGKPEVKTVLSFDGRSEAEVLKLAAAVERWSEHPLAEAILREAQGLDVPASGDFQALVGRGATAIVNGQTIFAGNRRLFSEHGMDLTSYENEIAALEASGQTVILVGGTRIVGAIGMRDTIRENAAASLEALKAAGIEKVAMLTGDHESAAAAVAATLKIDEAFGGLLPERKVDCVRALRQKYGRVAMVGDGVNDAPALATADIGVAMGTMGSDAALATADIALMSDDLGKLSQAIALSRRTVAVIRQNITFSILIKLAFIVGTFVGFTNLWLAVLADSGAAVLVTLNGMRLAKENKYQ